MTKPVDNDASLSGRPDPEAKFWDRVAEKYARSKIGDEDAYQHKLEVTQALFTNEMKVLEFGCGTGSTAIIHAPHVKHYLATDIAPAMLKIAMRKTAEAHIGNLSFEQATLSETLKSGDRFDAVLGMSVLHLVDDMKTTVREAYEILESGGVFVSSTTCMSNSFWFMRPFMPIGRFFGWLPQVRFFSRTTLEDTLKDTGFTIEKSWQPKKLAAVFIIARK